MVTEKLGTLGYGNIPVKFVTREGSRIAASVGENPKIYVSDDARIRESEMV